MRHYYDMTSGSCFAGACLVEMHDGTRTRVESVRKGDKVLGGGEVVCVVRTDPRADRSDRPDFPHRSPSPPSSPRSLVKLGALLVTAWHPIRAAGPRGEWVFPCTVEGATVVPHDGEVYNFVLGGPDGPDGPDGHAHEMTIEGIVCVTLGHGLDGPVVAHPYYGTKRVLDDLRRMRGWDKGLVRLAGTVRLSGLVCGLVDAEESIAPPERLHKLKTA
jgi:hypothetical protein